MAKQVTFNDDTNERDKELVGKIKLFSKEKKMVDCKMKLDT